MIRKVIFCSLTAILLLYSTAVVTVSYLISAKNLTFPRIPPTFPIIAIAILWILFFALAMISFFAFLFPKKKDFSSTVLKALSFLVSLCMFFIISAFAFFAIGLNVDSYTTNTENYMVLDDIYSTMLANEIKDFFPTKEQLNEINKNDADIKYSFRSFYPMFDDSDAYNITLILDFKNKEYFDKYIDSLLLEYKKTDQNIDKIIIREGTFTDIFLDSVEVNHKIIIDREKQSVLYSAILDG
jgi:hypothetical protein